MTGFGRDHRDDRIGIHVMLDEYASLTQAEVMHVRGIDYLESRPDDELVALVRDRLTTHGDRDGLAHLNRFARPELAILADLERVALAEQIIPPRATGGADTPCPYG